MPSITHLELHRGWVPLMDDDVWRSIMLRPNLEFFYPSSANYLEWDSFSRLVTDSLPGEIFPSLRCLEVAADTKTFQFLLPRLSALQEFVMETYIDFSQSASLGPIMQSLTSCSLLETGIFVGSGPVTSADLLNLASCCPLLSRLDVNLQSRQLEDSLDDEQFNTFVSRLKHLTVLQLRLPVNLSFQSLASVAIHCPQMRFMQVRARIDVAELANAPDSIRFPCMESLVVSDVFMDGEWCSSSTSRHNWSKGSNPALERIMDPRFPVLNFFAFYPTRVRPAGINRQMLSRGQLILRPSSGRPPRVDVRSDMVRALIDPVPGNPYNSRF